MTSFEVPLSRESQGRQLLDDPVSDALHLRPTRNGSDEDRFGASDPPPGWDVARNPRIARLSCPQDNGGLFLQKPLTSVVAPRRRRIDVARGIAGLWGLVLYQQFNATNVFTEMDNRLNAVMRFPRLDPQFARLLPGVPVRRQALGMPDRRWIASGILANAASAFAHHSPVGPLAMDREVGIRAASLPARDHLWVIGDGLVGPSTVVEAMSQGRRAATAVLAGNRRRAA